MNGPPPFFIFIFVIIVLLAMVTIAVKVITGMAEWTDNNSQPVTNMEARVVSKRVEVSGGKQSTSTAHFATFEMPGGERREFGLKGSEYGQLAEADAGQLAYQGTRYLGFQRSGVAEEEPAVKPAANPAPMNLVCDYCGSAIPAGMIKCTGCGWTWHPKPKDIVET